MSAVTERVPITRRWEFWLHVVQLALIAITVAYYTLNVSFQVEQNTKDIMELEQKTAADLLRLNENISKLAIRTASKDDIQDLRGDISGLREVLFAYLQSQQGDNPRPEGRQ